MLVRQFAQAALGLGAALLLWRSRLIQVAAFAAAAGLRGQYRAQKPGRAASRSSEWLTVPHPATARAPMSPHVLVTYHPEYHAFDPGRAIASLLAATQLGVGWIRTDIRWREILPDGVARDLSALAWYRDFLTAVCACGLKPLLVLSTPPEAVLRRKGSERLESWSRFVEVVATDLGSLCGVYQLMNEPNNPVYSFFPLAEAAGALTRGASIIRSLRPEAKLAINVSMEFWGWRAFLTDILRLSGLSVPEILTP
jgi:hypothetical protein